MNTEYFEEARKHLDFAWEALSNAYDTIFKDGAPIGVPFEIEIAFNTIKEVILETEITAQ